MVISETITFSILESTFILIKITTMALGSSARLAELDSSDIIKEFCARDNGVVTFSMEWVNSTGQMVPSSEDILFVVIKRQESSNGRMVVVTKVISMIVNFKEEAHLLGRTAEYTEDNGEII